MRLKVSALSVSTVLQYGRSEVSVPAGSDVTALGVWLDSYCGVAVDCMSSRGFSGVTLRDISPEVCRALTDAGLGYDFIVLEFGINAMSAGQTDYTSYGKLMAKVVEHIRNCYPNAVIMLMGIGDRGQKQGAEVRSMPSAVHMVDAQRQVARATGILFWDTREAMGGDGAIVSWAGASPPRANKDYIHLNHHGGAVLATEFVKSLKMHSILKYILCVAVAVSAGYLPGAHSSSRRRHPTMMRTSASILKSITGRQSTTRKKSRYRLFIKETPTPYV